MASPQDPRRRQPCQSTIDLGLDGATYPDGTIPQWNADLQRFEPIVGGGGGTPGPQGPQGIQGVQGIQGPQGDPGTPGASTWGSITGTLSAQTDLQTALNAKEATANKGAASGYASLDAGTKIPIAQIPTGSTASTVALGNDARLSDARTPTAHTHPESEVTNLVADLALKAPLASPAFSGTPTGITKTHVGLANVDNTSDANKPVSTAQQAALDLKANLAGPTFTGLPAAPTAAVDTNTTQLATTAMVLAQAAAATPLMDAAAAVGTSTRFARADHVHPVDTSRAPLASPTFTGTVTLPAVTLGDGATVTISATTGTSFGQSGSKIGFFGVTPVVRPTALTQTYSTAASTHPAVTQLAPPAGGTGTAAGGWSTAANRDLAIASINAGAADLLALKKFVNQIVDQLQALGILQ